MCATSSSPCGPLGPPTTTRWASGWSRTSEARAETATPAPFSGWMRPTKSRSGPVGRQPEGPTGLGAVPGSEEGVLDTGGDDADPGGVGPVELGELGRLHRARGEHGVRAPDDRGLGLRPEVGGVGLDFLGARLGLDPVEGVEGRHQRQVELMLDRVAGDPAEPVVGVDRVEGRGVVTAVGTGGGDRLDHPLGKLVDHARERLLGHRPRRSGGDVVDPETGLDVEHRCEVVRPGPGVHVTEHAGPGQRRRELTHVHVHAATVPGAGLGQGRGMEGEDGQTLHAPTILPGGPRYPAAAADPAASWASRHFRWSRRVRPPGRGRPGSRSRGGRRDRSASSPGAGPRSGGGRRRCGE